jgi:hypothetical protein
VHWDGSSWNPVPIPSPGGRYNELTAVAAISSNEVWTVGWYDDLSTGTDYNLIEHYAPTPCATKSVTPPTGTPALTTTRTPTSPPTQTPSGASATTVPSNTPTHPLSTQTPGAATATATATATACPLQFSDVDPSNPFYSYIRCLACRGIVSGYSDGTFRPNNNVTRGQMSKFVSNAANYQDPIPSTQQTFSDVPPGSTFWIYVERAYLHGVINGYSSSPPCTMGTPCFLPANPVTRGQAAKFVSQAAHYRDPIPPTQQTFTDVAPTNTFWLYIERVHMHGVVSGYSTNPPCTTGVPCFLPVNHLTRGQTSKFIANAFFPDCEP